MNQSFKIALLVSAIAVASGCANNKQSATTANLDSQTYTEMKAEIKNNSLLAEWTGPSNGVPAFDKVKLEDLKPAMEYAMAVRLERIEKIAAQKDKPTFENTIAKLEASGPELNQVFAYYGIWRANMSSPEVRKISGELAPKLSEHFSKVSQNKALVARVKAVKEGDEYASLTPQQKRVVDETYIGFTHNGATLEGDAKKRYAAINKELAELHAKFGNNVLADEENYVLYLTKNQLSGLPESVIAAAASAAEARGKKGQYAITNTRSSMDPFLTYSDERELRKKVWTTYYSRGNNGDQFDNNDIIAKILKLRHERVNLLGYKNYASWRLKTRMAQNPDEAMTLMKAVWPAATARVKEEVADMQALADKEKANIKIEPWDYRYYAEKVRKQKYDLNSDEVKQYLQLGNLTDAMFYVAGRLFKFEFTPVKEGSVPVFHSDVKVWEVTHKETGEHIGLWYLDPFARQGKRSGAWASEFRSHSTFNGKTTVLSTNNSNFVKTEGGKPVLISWDDAETFFHEFGHALHSLSSKVDYPSLNRGVRDYTEFQSQLLERWLLTDEVIKNYLLHAETGKPMPTELVAKIKNASKFNNGFKTTEYLASALVDMAFHTTDPENINPVEFEAKTLKELGMPKEIVMRHRTTHFGHIFSGEGYSAGYYGYMWADVLTSDAAEAFTQAPGGFYDEALSKKLVDHLFAIRNAMNPAEAYRLFRGRDAQIEALMRDRGFPIGETAKN